MEELEGVYESQTREACYYNENLAQAKWVTFKDPVGEVLLDDTIHCPAVIMEFAQEIGAVYGQMFIVTVGDGRPYLYTKEQLERLLHA